VELREIEENFEIDRSIVSALKGAELADTTAAERRRVWAKHEGRNTRYIAEYLLPRLVRSIDRAWPEFVREQSRQADFPSEKLRATVESLESRLDLDTMQPTKAHSLEFNDIGAVRIAVARPIAADPYAANRATGSFILIDEATHRTAGAGMIDG